jgi:predicted secreted protein
MLERMKIGRVGMLAVAWMVLAGAGHAQGGGVDASKAAPQSVAITEGQDGQTIKVRVGDEAVVTFVAAAGTGSAWDMEPLSSPVATLASREGVAIPPAMPGSPTKHLFHIKIQAAGTVTLHFDYRRVWEHGTSPAKTFTVTLRAE